MSKPIRMMIAGIFCLAAVATARAEVIWHKSAGDRQDYWKYATMAYASIKVDFGVWPVAPGHSAGAVYTDDGWQTVYWQDANWEANVSNPFGGQDEAWAVRLFGNGNNGQYVGQPFEPFYFEYAIYVVNQSGQWAWDNNGGFNFQYLID